MKCPYCGTYNQPGEDFCSNCGGALDATVANTATVASGNVVTAGGTVVATTGGGSITSGTLTPNVRLQNGRYVVEKILGQGGMGAAVLARDTRVSNKAVVIKELVSDQSDPRQRQEDVRNFEREVETLATIDHPLVPTVTDSFQEGSRYFMVQEYAAGENLENHMERINQPMPEQEALTYISQVLDILDYLSQQTPPIIHRDIKPANIIIGAKDKRARLVDFGIARADVAKHSQRKQTSALGTPGYAPPEQYQGNADARSDLYALAATLHHLVTNRDPRNYPPFSYPLVRTLNPKITPDTERVLERALTLDVNKRYQNAAAMKHDVDEILQRLGKSADTSVYVRGTSGPIGNTNTVRNTPLPVHVTPPPPPPPPPAFYGASRPGGAMNQQQVGTYAPPARQKRGGNHVMFSFLLLLLVLGLVGLALFVFPRLRSTSSSNTQQTATIPSGDPISVTMQNGEPLGISQGAFAFDTTNRKGGDLMKQASEKFAAGDTAAATTLWRQALGADSSNAEALIYLENQRVLTSGRPYVTIVVGTMISGNNVSVGRDNLQGAYVAQMQYNASGGAKLGGVMVRVLIANAGNDSTNADRIAQQIVQAAKADPTIVGIMGWPFSRYALNAMKTITQAQIPMVSQTASSDELTGISPFFFRVAPSNMSQAKVGANYAKNKLNAQNVVVFKDSADSYSASLADDFTAQFKNIGGNVISPPVTYTVGNAQSISDALTNALNSSPKPDLIYFAGYASDAGQLLTDLVPRKDFPKLQVLGGDALYDLGGYPGSAREAFDRLRFTAFAYPDEWDILGYGGKKPAFFTDYAKAFNPSGQTPSNPYGFTRAANNVLLSYDASQTLLAGCKIAIDSGKKKPTSVDLQQALMQIKGANAVQGVSGQISFGTDNDPSGKAVIVLYVAPGGFIKMEAGVADGTFLAGQG